MIGAPPSVAGGDHISTTLASSGSAVRPCGAPGGLSSLSRMVTVAVATPIAASPVALLSLTVKVSSSSSAVSSLIGTLRTMDVSPTAKVRVPVITV